MAAAPAILPIPTRPESDTVITGILLLLSVQAALTDASSESGLSWKAGTVDWMSTHDGYCNTIRQQHIAPQQPA